MLGSRSYFNFYNKNENEILSDCGQKVYNDNKCIVNYFEAAFFCIKLAKLKKFKVFKMEYISTHSIP